MKRALLFLSMLVFTASIPAFVNTVLYTQPGNNLDGYPSFTNGEVQYDNFTTTGGTVGQVDWSGFVPTIADQNQPFVINFYADNAGAPGTLLSTNSIPFTDTNQTSQGSFFGGVYNKYQYSADVSPLTLTDGTQYWISIAAVNVYGWYWNTADGGDNASYQSDIVSGFVPKTYDDAFTLESTTTVAATPEPGSIVLLGTGILGTFGAVRRRLS